MKAPERASSAALRFTDLLGHAGQENAEHEHQRCNSDLGLHHQCKRVGGKQQPTDGVLVVRRLDVLCRRDSVLQ